MREIKRARRRDSEREREGEREREREQAKKGERVFQSSDPLIFLTAYHF